MAIPRIKSTYSLDVDTVRTLEKIARRWNVSKSEALRRAVHAAARVAPTGVPKSIQALDKLQGSLGLNAGSARRWEERVRAERRASARRLKTEQK
jgi:hypothetical protein